MDLVLDGPSHEVMALVGMAPFAKRLLPCEAMPSRTRYEQMSRNATVILLAAAVALTPLAADAQFVIKAGASFASTTESDFVPDVSNKTGFALGIGYGIPLGGGGAFSLQLEALYVQKGGDLGNAGSLDIDELDVPILLQWNTPIRSSCCS